MLDVKLFSIKFIEKFSEKLAKTVKVPQAQRPRFHRDSFIMSD